MQAVHLCEIYRRCKWSELLFPVTGEIRHDVCDVTVDCCAFRILTSLCHRILCLLAALMGRESNGGSLIVKLTSGGRS